MPFDPNRAIPADEANISPTTLVMNFLQKQGMSPSNPNFSQAMRTALEQNARQPGFIPGLDNNAPSTEAEDQAAMAAAGKGRGGGGGGARPAPSAAPTGGGGPSGPMDKRDESTDTSAQPPANVPPAGGSGGMSTGQMIGLGIPVGLAGLWGASKFLGGGGNAVAGGTPLPPPTPELGGAGGAPTSLEPAVMDKAMAPAGPEPLPPPPTSPIERGLPPGPIENFQPIPPGHVNPVDPAITEAARLRRSTPDPAVVNEAAIASGARPAPNVPFQPRPGTGARTGQYMPTVGSMQDMPLAARILKGLAGGLRGARIP